MRDLREKHARGEVPMFKEKLDSYKKEFTKQNLVVAEETYVELKAKQEHTLSLKEFIQVRVFEAVQNYAEDLNQNEGETKQIFHNFKQTQNKLERSQIEVKSLQNQLKDIRDDSERRVSALERRNLELESSLHQINAQYNLLNEKSGKINSTDE